MRKQAENGEVSPTSGPGSAAHTITPKKQSSEHPVAPQDRLNESREESVPVFEEVLQRKLSMKRRDEETSA